MITATVYRRGSLISAVSAEGHSGYADAGSDIVCAAVTSAVRLSETYLNDTLGLGAGVTIDESRTLIKLSAPFAEAQTIFTSFERLMNEYASEYPGYIRVLFKEDSV